MRTITVAKDQFGMIYKSEFNSASWERFPDDVTTPEQIENFFTQNGKYDKPQLIFSGDKSGSKKLYQVTRKGNKITALVDFQNILSFAASDFMSFSEQIEFLQQKATTEVTREAEQLETDKEKFRYYLENANQDCIDELRIRINETMTDSKITELRKLHAKEYFNKEAIVEFG